MITLDNIHISFIKRIIGSRINYISSNRFDVFRYEITCVDRVLKLSMYNTRDLLIRSDFFENDCGDMFHDYTLEEIGEKTDDNAYSKYYIQSSPVKRIEVYGRLFPLTDFGTYPEIYNKYAGINHADNLFLFHFNDSGKVMILFHDYFPTINIYIGSKLIQQFFENTRSEYSLRHTVE